MLAGIRFLLRDRLLRVLGVTALVANGLGQMLGAGLTVLAYEEYSSSRVAGAFFAAFGAGAVVGSIVAVRIVGALRPAPARRGRRFVALTLPIFALAFELPVPAVMVALAASSFFGPLVNAPLIGVITMRTPEALRAKVMTAVLTIAMLAGPVGLLLAGPLLEAWGPRPVFLLVAAGQLLATIPFALVAFRVERRGSGAPVDLAGLRALLGILEHVAPEVVHQPASGRVEEHGGEVEHPGREHACPGRRSRSTSSRRSIPSPKGSGSAPGPASRAARSGVRMSISIPKPPTSSPSVLRCRAPVPSNSHGRGVAVRHVERRLVPSRRRSPGTARREPRLGARGARHCATRRISCPRLSTRQKKLFAERNISRPPRSR